EIAKLTDSLSMFIEVMGAENALVRKTLDGKSPQGRAAELVKGSSLADVNVRKKLAAGGLAAIQSSTDPMIRLALLVEPESRALRRTHDDKVNEPLSQAYGKIAKARFAIYGTDVYPDATFTPRLSFGTVRGYTAEGKQFPWATTIGGTYQHAKAHGDAGAFALPLSWVDAKDRLNLNTPFNFVNTADIIGGNSGSPVVNRAGEVVGLIFDGNIYSLVWDYLYTERRGRAIAVHSAGILDALKNVYDATGLIAELTSPQRRGGPRSYSEKK
ncbi:MAG: S46 family peptidase, partial [Acidobacteria bacterium]|nr:S46 family peptidase [Acidobacteriota bacterium]